MSRHSNCRNCVHYGCCDVPCGGLRFTSKWVECDRCGITIDVTASETVATPEGWVCLSCAEEIEAQEEAKEEDCEVRDATEN